MRVALPSYTVHKIWTTLLADFGCLFTGLKKTNKIFSFITDCPDFMPFLSLIPTFRFLKYVGTLKRRMDDTALYNIGIN